MDFVQILVLTLQITQVFTKSRKSKSKKLFQSSSEEESIENLLYYKDCQRKAKEEPQTVTAEPLRYEEITTPAPRPPDCPFPKMCCALTCGSECNSQPSFMPRQMEPMQSMPQFQSLQPIPQPRQPPIGSVQPQIVQRRKKKLKFPPNKMQPPLPSPPLGPTRRDMGFSKEKIKSLISHDDDIRKILKDLVRVTMQKVDLLDKINTKRSIPGEETAATPPKPYEEYDD